MDEKEDVTGALDRLTGLLQKIDAAREETMDLLMEKNWKKLEHG